MSDPVQPADILWHDARPRSARYGDIYFSDDGVDEFHRVFAAPQALSERMAQADRLTVVELGFGSGTNFALTAALAERQHCELHYIAVEANPFADADLAKITALLQLREASAARWHEHLCRVQPARLPGWQQRRLASVLLTTFWGDVGDFMAELARWQTAGVDAWLLDGFAPDKNPQMWSALEAIGPLSKPQATVATFTAAGFVRRALQAAGFEMRRVDQRPHKRESLAGHLRPERSSSTPKHAAPACVRVLGGGIAGASAARTLAELGVEVDVWEPQPQAAFTVLQHGRLLGDDSAQAELRSKAYLYALNQPGPAHTIGALQLPGSTADANKLARIHARYQATGRWLELVQPEAGETRFGVPIEGAALWFPAARRIDLGAWCAAALRHSNITVIAQKGSPSSDYPTIAACGAASRVVAQCPSLETAAIGGQLDEVQTEKRDFALVGNGYQVPTESSLLVGATYEHHPWAAEEASAHNLKQLDRPYRWLARHRAERCVSSDRTPIIGPVPGSELRWLSTAHGSMGATTAPLAAAMLASQLLGHAPPVSEQAFSAVEPERFARRQARRGVRMS